MVTGTTLLPVKAGIEGAWNALSSPMQSHRFAFYRTLMEDENAEIEADESEREKMSQVERRQGMLDKYHQNKQFMQEWQTQGVAAHTKNMANRREETKRCLRYELATKENKARRKALRTENARHDVEDFLWI